MKRTYLKLGLIGLIVLFSGCKSKHTESYYFSHPRVLSSVLLLCQENNHSSDQECELAHDTAVKMTRLMQVFVDDQVAFGQRILHAQIRASDLAKQLAVAEKAHSPDAEELKQRLSLANEHVNRLRDIVGIFIKL